MDSIIEAVHKHAERQPDKTCLIEDGKKKSYKEVFGSALAFANFLKGKALSKGDRIVVRTSQTINHLVSGLGIQLAGGVFLPLENTATKEGIKEIIRETDAKIYISPRDDKIAEELGIVGINNNVIDGLDVPEKNGFGFPKRDDIAEILWTTGSTGKSKGVVLTHGSMVAVAENVKYGTEQKDDNIEIIPGPYNHSNPYRRYLANMITGSAVVVTNGVTFVKKFFNLIEEHKVTSIALVPAFVSMIFKLSGGELGKFKGQLDYVQIGGAKFPDSDKEKLRTLLPSSRLYDLYGSTEAGVSTIFDFNKYRDKKSCVGTPTKNSLFKFFDGDGNEIKATADNPGFIATGGTMLMKEYFNAPELTRETIINGFIHSKDLAYVGSDGMIYVIGRKDDIINYGGIKISPHEIEDIAKRYDGVSECMLIPIRDETFGQIPKLFIEVKNGFDIKPFRKFLSEKIDASKFPQAIEITERFPLLPNGKLDRRKMEALSNCQTIPRN